jgi:hypothetical protein
VLDELERLCEEIGREPTGFIFHMSRCGSTLISRCLSALDRALVISEPLALNDLLRPTAEAHADRDGWLRAMLRAFDQRPARGAEWYFVKFSSWNVLEIGRIRAAFARTPCCFVFREPVEVMVSVLQQPPGWLRWKSDPVCGAYLLGKAADRVARLADEEFAAHALARYCQTALASDGLWPLEYTQLPAALWTLIPRFFGLDLTTPEVERMRQVAEIDTKDATGTRRFAADSLAKRQRASPQIRTLCRQRISGPIAQLRERGRSS